MLYIIAKTPRLSLRSSVYRLVLLTAQQEGFPWAGFIKDCNTLSSSSFLF